MYKDDSSDRIASSSQNSVSDKQDNTHDEKRRCVRWEAVKHKFEIGEMGEVVAGDLKYLAGRESGYQELHSSHHSMSLRALAIQLQRLTASFSRRRRRALNRAFKWLTGYENYTDAWDTADEERILTDKGIVQGELGFCEGNDSDDDN